MTPTAVVYFLKGIWMMSQLSPVCQEAQLSSIQKENDASKVDQSVDILYLKLGFLFVILNREYTAVT